MDVLRSLFIGAVLAISSLRGVNPTIVNITPPSPVIAQTTSSNSSNILEDSRNWAGYIASSGTFSSVTASWNVPNIPSNSSNYGADATWVGIGGVNSTDLIQAGTQSTVNRNGQVSYQPFYETLPQPSNPLNISINAGDSVTVSVSEQSPNLWLISFKDNSTGQSTSESLGYSSSLSSAEWVEEAPSGFRRILPLDNFGTISFSEATAQENGESVDLVTSNARPITMTDGATQPLATASLVGSDDESFSVTRTSASDNISTTIQNYFKPNISQHRAHIFRRRFFY